MKKNVAGLLLGVAATVALYVGPAQAITYDVTFVQFELGEHGSGEFGGLIMSSNLPSSLSLTTSSASYSGAFGTVDPNTGTIIPVTGQWTLSDGAGNDLAIGFDLSRYGNNIGAPLTRGTGLTSIIDGASTGTFQGATGGGTVEVFARDYFSSQGSSEFQHVVVNRMQINLLSGDPQTDTRPVSVSVRLGVNDTTTQSGQNVGGLTSDNSPISFPRMTNLYAEYSYAGPFPHAGTSQNSNASGDSQNWSFDITSGGDVVLPGGPHDIFFYSSAGTADLVNGTGFYEGYTGQSDWLAFESWMFQLSPTLSTYSNVVIDRYTLTPVPEPQTYVLLAAGLAVVGFSAGRRRRTN
jgi:hypothetical protein